MISFNFTPNLLSTSNCSSKSYLHVPTIVNHLHFKRIITLFVIYPEKSTIWNSPPHAIFILIYPPRTKIHMLKLLKFEFLFFNIFHRFPSLSHIRVVLMIIRWSLVHLLMITCSFVDDLLMICWWFVCDVAGTPLSAGPLLAVTHDFSSALQQTISESQNNFLYFLSSPYTANLSNTLYLNNLIFPPCSLTSNSNLTVYTFGGNRFYMKYWWTYVRR